VDVEGFACRHGWQNERESTSTNSIELHVVPVLLAGDRYPAVMCSTRHCRLALQRDSYISVMNAYVVPVPCAQARYAQHVARSGSRADWSPVSILKLQFVCA
jgi:hypothetical protein